MSNNTKLTSAERTLLKTASVQSQNINQLARNFREMLINRECITSLTTLPEFMANGDLMEAIKLSWMLGYSDQITPKNLSLGLISNYDFIQVTPNSNASLPTDDVDILNKLTLTFNKERRTMRRNIDTFIRNMGWVEEEEVERKTKKRVTNTKEQVIKKVDNLLDTSSTASSSVTTSPTTILSESLSRNPSKSLSSNTSMSAKTTKSSDSTQSEVATMEVSKVPDTVGVDDNQSEVTDSVEMECRKYLKKMLTNSGIGCGILSYLDSDGDVQMSVVDANVLDRAMESIIDGNMKDMGINDN